MISHVGRYEITGVLGQGAMGTVYKARDPLIERFVAIKTINLESLSKEEKADFEARFHQEAKAAGQLSHPNIVTIHELGESGNMVYLAMELLEGRELQNIIEDARHLSVDEALNIVIQVAAGLDYAHEAGIVHRDIKPSNIMVLKDGHVKITDFGIARMTSSLLRTQTGKIMGSPLYMSPEQVLAHPIDSRSDIFSLGVTLYQMLTGKLPFSGDDAHSVMYQVVNVDPPKPSATNAGLPDMLDAIVAKCLAKNPDERYPTARALADDLRSCRGLLRHSPAGADRRQVAASEALIQSRKMGRWKLAGIILLIAAVSIGVFELIELLFFSG